MSLIINLPTENDTVAVAQQLASYLSMPVRLSFSGEIGAGKTTFIRAMLQALGVNTVIKSPSYALVESYQGNQLSIHHFDLYRIQDETELEYIGFRDYFTENSICCVEWPERAPRLADEIDVNFTLSICGQGRTMQVNAYTPVGITIVTYLSSNS